MGAGNDNMGSTGSLDALFAAAERMHRDCPAGLTFRDLALVACRLMAAAEGHRGDPRDVLAAHMGPGESIETLDKDQVRQVLRYQAGFYADLALAAHEKGL